MKSSCIVCGKPGAARCQAHERKTNPAYHDPEYMRNRQIMINLAWDLRHPCWKCKKPFSTKKDITADHRIPLREWKASGKAGSPHHLSNLMPAHETCNKGWNRKKEITPPLSPETYENKNDYLEW